MIRKNSREAERLKEYEKRLRQWETELKSEDDLCRIHMISPDRIRQSPFQPRRDFDDASLLALADSIRQYGMLQPVSVRRVSMEDSPFGGLYELIAGERRLRAARLLQLPYVPCIIIETEGSEAAALALVENMQRCDLGMFEEAEAIASLCTCHGMTQSECAGFLSVSQPYVANKLRLLRLTREERARITENGLSERHARALVKIQDDKKRTSALDEIISKGMNVRRTEEYVNVICQSTEQKPGIRKFVIRDIRIFLNTVDRAVYIVRQAGIPIEQTRMDEGDMIELKIRVPASGRQN